MWGEPGCLNAALAAPLTSIGPNMTGVSRGALENAVLPQATQPEGHEAASGIRCSFPQAVQ